MGPAGKDAGLEKYLRAYELVRQQAVGRAGNAEIKQRLLRVTKARRRDRLFYARKLSTERQALLKKARARQRRFADAVTEHLKHWRDAVRAATQTKALQTTICALRKRNKRLRKLLDRERAAAAVRKLSPEPTQNDVAAESCEKWQVYSESSAVERAEIVRQEHEEHRRDCCEKLRVVSEQWASANQTIDDMKASLMALRHKSEEVYSTVDTELRNHANGAAEAVTRVAQQYAAALDAARSAARDLQQRADALSGQVVCLEDKCKTEQDRRRRIQHELLELRGNIRVHCRVRKVLPMDVAEDMDQSRAIYGTSEERLDALAIVRALDVENVLVQPPDNNLRKSILTSSQVVDKQFEFDRVYGANDGQDVVFADAAPYVSAVLDGYNTCLMAYGETGSGKTYSLFGVPEIAEGIVPTAATELFDLIESRRGDYVYEVDVSILEVYNNEICDLLLDRATSARIRHDIMTSSADGKPSVEITNISRHTIKGPQDLARLIRQGMRRRTSASTLVHDHSSRSHCIVTLRVRARSRHTGAQTAAKMHFVDLAGSECVGMSGVTGQALAEAKAINKSLSALADVLKALSKRQNHVPYRNSKLTHILSDSIGGDAKMLLLVCISPTSKYLTETMQTLSFGLRARKVQKGPAKINRVPSTTSDDFPL